LNVRFAIVDPAATRELRRAVLRPHLSLRDRLPGDEVSGGVHVGAVDDAGTVLCTCFVYENACPWLPDRPDAWQLRQMATLPEYRGRGLGAGVVAAAADLVRSRGGSLLWCFAREAAAPFYVRNGFRPYGPVFTDDEHSSAHQRMFRELSATPTASVQ
jgi:GNAT superfamily N-acetyltransferase